MQSRFLVLVIALSLVLLPARAVVVAAESPGVAVRIYDMSDAVQSVPDVAAGETPSEAKALPEIRLDETEFAPHNENFLTDVLTTLTIKSAGRYDFRLISDDGSQLYVDGRLAIDHDGPHGAVPRDATVALDAGRHALHIRHFQNGGDVHLELRWRPANTPEGVDFAPLPISVLSYDPALLEGAQPGKKRIIPALRRGRPGDGSPLEGVHPSFALGQRETQGGERAAATSNASVLQRVLAMGACALPKGELLATRVGACGAWIERRLESAGKIEPIVLFPPQARVAKLGVPGVLRSGAYEGQVLVGDAGSGQLWRVALDPGGDQMQGCVLRFSGAIADDGICAVATDAEGGFLAATCPSASKPGFDVLTLKPSGAPCFELHAVSARANGLLLQFTQPLAEHVGWEPDSYYIEQWPFDEAAGKAPARTGATTPVKSASVSGDRRSVFLEIEDLHPGNVVYLRLLPPCVTEQLRTPWSTEAWYTLRALPKERGETRARPPLPPQNLLTEAEKKDGWKLLFDGQTLAGWHNYQKKGPVAGWEAIDGSIVRTGPGGDIATDDDYGDFELKLEWRICAAGNSGIFFRVAERPGLHSTWQTGPEMQVLDNAEHADGRNPMTSAGSGYAMYAPPHDATRPVGLFNAVRIVARGPHVEYWLNGEKTVEYEIGSPDWKERVAASKFKEMPGYGLEPSGRITLQDHGDRVWYRNIKIRPLTRE